MRLMEISHGADGCDPRRMAARAGAVCRVAGSRTADASRPAHWRGLRRDFLAWKAQRETVRLLNAVDSATLRDLGITDIESQVYGDPSDRMRGYDRNWWRYTAR